MPIDPHPDHRFKTGWPAMLERAIAGDAVARDAFCDFALGFFRSRHWRLFHSIPESEHDDLLQELTLRALDRLPQYKPRPGVPFEAWLLVVGHHALLGWIRASAARREREKRWAEAASRRDDPPRAGGAIKWAAEQALRSLGKKCQLLLTFAFEGYAPADVLDTVRATLGDPTLTAKRVSDDTTFCRKRLRQRYEELALAGVYPKEVG